MKTSTNRDEKSTNVLELCKHQPITPLGASHDGMMAQRNLDQFVILLVDDNRGDIMLLKRAFSMEGLQIDFLVARDGEEAIAYLLSGDSGAHLPVPTHVLMDLEMPRQNGLEVLAWIRANTTWNHLPVIVFSGSDLASDISRAKQFAVDAFLPKGCGFEDTRAAVKAIAEIWNLRAAAAPGGDS